MYFAEGFILLLIIAVIVLINPDKNQIESIVNKLIKEDKKLNNNSLLIYTKGKYKERPHRNPNINPTNSIYMGKAFIYDKSRSDTSFHLNNFKL